MDYDFIFDRTTRQFSIRLAGEHEVLGRFLLDEFGQQAETYSALLQQLSSLTPQQSMLYQGREFLLEVDNSEVTLSHNSLFYQNTDEQAGQLQALAEDDLQLDEQGMTSQCGLDDFLLLLREWQQFLAD
ncbi:YacL family protein [Arsukibacterium sp. UBA3155]|uniref:YacL family protein n=1 Tax=Arsukibacterium sp. UBA3155 TaxID=1946058 RepID=UPI0025C06C65|nr:YacL family protein [Arsukibacterium sp. UBA3155]|tara:strand:+ start:255570 stop:255956 length:387 start_codon:yes stop_codon:yes gene_type:complete